MPIKSNNDDRRTRRTRRSLSDALFNLIREKHYDSITVQNVIDLADVGRSTFYAHYRDKEDLFLSGWERLLDEFARHIKWENVGRERTIPVLELFRHVQEFYDLYRGLARSRKLDLLYKNGVSYLTKSIEKQLISYLADKPQPSAPAAVMSNYLASEVFSLLRWWLEHNRPYTPERMDEIFHELVIPGFRSVLGGIEADAK